MPDTQMLWEWSRRNPIKKMKKQELSAFFAHSALEGSEEQRLFLAANHYYDMATISHAQENRMKAVRKFKQAVKLFKARVDIKSKKNDERKTE